MLASLHLGIASSPACWSDAELGGKAVIFYLGFISLLMELSGELGIGALLPKESTAFQDTDFHLDLEEGSAYWLAYYISPW